MQEPDYIRAHETSIHHREELLSSRLCGCFYCLAVFEPAHIRLWCDRDQTRLCSKCGEAAPEQRGPYCEECGRTAMCPECGIDSVIGSAAGYPLTAEFLGRMREHWFGASEEDKG